MTQKITIKFYRTLRNTRKLKKIASNFNHYEMPENIDDSCQVEITKDSTIEEYKTFNYLWGIIQKYKETAMYANERLLIRNQSENILGWIRCYCNCEYFPDKSDYCCISPGLKHLHGWGCKWLHSVLRHSRFGGHNGIYWYKVGPFASQIQYIDKQDIRDKLAAEAEIKCLQLCPLFSLPKAFCFVDELPDQINPQNDTEWEYEFSKEPEEKDKIIGVKPKEINIFNLLEG